MRMPGKFDIDMHLCPPPPPIRHSGMTSTWSLHVIRQLLTFFCVKVSRLFKRFVSLRSSRSARHLMMQTGGWRVEPGCVTLCLPLHALTAPCDEFPPLRWLEPDEGDAGQKQRRSRSRWRWLPGLPADRRQAAGAALAAFALALALATWLLRARAPHQSEESLDRPFDGDGSAWRPSAAFCGRVSS